jgi:hypothetical protein
MSGCWVSSHHVRHSRAGTLVQYFMKSNKLDPLPAAPDSASTSLSSFIVAANEMPEATMFVLRMLGKVYFDGKVTQLAVLVDGKAAKGTVLLSIDGTVQKSFSLTLAAGEHLVDVRSALPLCWSWLGPAGPASLSIRGLPTGCPCVVTMFLAPTLQGLLFTCRVHSAAIMDRPPSAGRMKGALHHHARSRHWYLSNPALSRRWGLTILWSTDPRKRSTS